MNVLLITPLYPPATGGAATYFGAIASPLAQHPALDRVIVLTERMAGVPAAHNEGKFSLRRLLPSRLSVPRRSWLGHAVSYATTQAWFAARLPRFVQREKVDLIHFHTRYRGRYFYDALRRTHLPVLADLRDKMTDPQRLHETASRLLCCGEGVYDFAVESGFPRERVSLIPNVFMPPECPTEITVARVHENYRLTGKRYVLYVGDITGNKGVYELLAAYQSWQRDHPEVALVLAGTNREGNKFLAQLHRTPGAVYLGHLPHPDILVLMHSAEMVILPSRSEGLPTVILEAIAMGAKVIGPPGIPEFLRHLPEFMLPEVSVPAILETLDKIWKYPARPIYSFDHHHVDHIVEALVALYRSMGHPDAVSRL